MQSPKAIERDRAYASRHLAVTICVYPRAISLPKIGLTIATPLGESRTFNQHKPMKKILATILIFSAIGLGVIAFGVPAARLDRMQTLMPSTAAPTWISSSAIVQLKGDPISTNPSTKPPHGRKIDFNSQGVRSYRAQLNQKRNEFKHWLRANAPRARVTGEYDVSLNAVAVQLNGTPLATIAAAPMVQSAEYNALYHPNLSESYKIINASGRLDCRWRQGDCRRRH